MLCLDSVLAPGALHVFTHLAEDLFLSLSNRLLLLSQPGFAERLTEVYVTWVTPLHSALSNRGVSQAAVMVFVLAQLSAAASAVAFGEGAAPQLEQGGLLCSQVRKGRAWRDEHHVQGECIA